MMNPQIETLTVTVPLALTAHSQGNTFRRYQSHPNKANQVYLNTLAVYAVNFYLQCQEFETNLEESDSWDPIMQTLLDVADLVVTGRGKLECRPVLPQAEVVRVPAEVWDDRIGYVVVQLDESWREATLLGFVETVNSEELPLTQLRSLEELPEYLNHIRPTTDLSQWWEGIVAAGWQAVENLVAPPETHLAFRLRMAHQFKLIELGQSGQSVEMRVTLTEAAEAEINITLAVQPFGYAQGEPVNDQPYLPANLELMLLNEDGAPVLDAYASSDNKIIELEFTGEPGDRFSVKVTWGDISVTEKFVV